MKTKMKKSFGSLGAWDLIRQIPLAKFVLSSDDYHILRMTAFSLVKIYRPALDRLEPEG